MVRGILIGFILLSGFLLFWSMLPLFSPTDLAFSRAMEPIGRYRTEIILVSMIGCIASIIGVLLERRRKP